MAATANIVIADGQTTPQNVTFAPERASPELSSFVDRSSGVSFRFRRLSVRNQAANGKMKTNLQLSLPIFGTLPSGSQGIVYTLRAKLDIELPDGCTDAERKDLYALFKNSLDNTLVRGALRDLDPIY